MTPRPPPANQRGVSLIEALVAMAVMAFGMLGIAGIQASLRTNGDIAKQRSEAVRIAQASMERRRAFSVIDTTANTAAYADIVGFAAPSEDGLNARYDRVEVVQTMPSAGQQDLVAPRKTVSIGVGWTDRSGNTQTVRIASIVSRTSPEMQAALAVPAVGSPLQGAQGRNAAIPPAAVDQVGEGVGTSRFALPGAGAGSLVFSNSTGFITQFCNSSNICVATNARLLSGFVRFATSADPPTTASARVPPDTATDIAPLASTGVVVTLDATGSPIVDCFEDANLFPGSIAYYCAVPIASGSFEWSGQSTLTVPSLATSATETSASRYRVCRYTSDRRNTDTPPVPNEQHPFRYAAVRSALTNQNFLVIRAGDGTVAFSCPDDSASVTGRTFAHQPAS